MFERIFCALFLFCSCCSLAAVNFSNVYTHAGNSRPERLKVCGERCSGTNFVLYLLHQNFPALQPTELHQFGHKHYLWWFDAPVSKKKLKRLKYSSEEVALSNSQNCLFVVVVRDPYDWLRSFYLKPWDVHKKLCKKGFKHFVSSQWKLKSKKFTLVDGQNPWTKKPFANVLELRKYKMCNYLRLGKLVDNYLFVRYEDVRDDPRGFVDFVASSFNLTKADPFVPLDIILDTSIPPNLAQPGIRAPFIRNPYFPIPDRTLNFINKKIDWQVETLAGYCIKEKVE